MKKIKNASFYKGALILMLFGFLSKIIGAIYRIPLTKIVGAEGMGIYQMIFPLYTLMLTVSSSGLPSSISKLISENLAKNRYKQANQILKASFLLLVCFSIFCATIVFILSGTIAKFQGNRAAGICYLGIAPAIIFVGLISGFRGYFQGMENMVPSAVSGLIEQLVKMGVGLFFASKLIVKGVNYGVLGAMLGISLSELVAFLYLLVIYIFKRKKTINLIQSDSNALDKYSKTIKSILSLSVFVTLGGLIMPLTMLIDSSLVINILKSIGYQEGMATKLFGLQTGIVGAIINMPVVLSLSISTSILPCISKHVANREELKAQEKASKAVFLTTMLALPASIGCMVYAEPIIRLLYSRSLTQEEILISCKILEVASISVFYLALLQVSTGILQGLSKFWVPLISLGIGAVVKTILNLALIRIESINIIGAEVSTVVCYMVALIINLLVLKKFNILKLDCKIFVILVLSMLIFLTKPLFVLLNKLGINYYVSFFMTIFIIIIVYFLSLYILQKLHKKLKEKNKLKKIFKKL